jgi:hypothetical protein
MAINYNELSFREAAKSSDLNLTALSYLNKGKTYQYFDYDTSERSLARVIGILECKNLPRITCASRVALLALNLLHCKQDDIQDVSKQAHQLLQEAIDGSYADTIVRTYLVMAVANFLTAEKRGSYETTQKLIKTGIDCSIKYGIPTHIWQFYNLLGITQIHLNAKSDEVKRTFETMYSMLSREHLLHLGERNLCYGNILALSNIGYFFQSRQFENEFYKKIAPVTYFGGSHEQNYSNQSDEYSYSDSMEKLKCEYLNARNMQVLFTNDSTEGLLRDPSTQYFIPIS